MELAQSTPNGVIHDPDTVYADIMSKVDNEVSGIAREIFQLWEKSGDRKALEELFYALTGIKFESYVDLCLIQTTRCRATERLEIPCVGGTLCAVPSDDHVLCPGILVYFRKNDGDVIDLCYAEGDGLIPDGISKEEFDGHTNCDGGVNLYIWEDPNSDDYTQRIRYRDL